VWDVAIIQRAIRLYHNSSQVAFKSSIENELVISANIATWLSCTPTALNNISKACIMKWAKESFRDALSYAYSNEYGMEISDGDTLSETYFETRLEIVRRRLAAGGVRLAAALESLFSSDSDAILASF